MTKWLVIALMTIGCNGGAGEDDGVEPGCGNGVVEDDELCDALDLGGASCSTLINTATGDLACRDNCRFDTSGCTPSGPYCGNDVDDGGPEVCDGSELPAGQDTCAENHFLDGNGPPGCMPSCGGIDLSACGQPENTGPGTCGDGNRQNDEDCDTDNLNGRDCTDFGYAAGTLACHANCSFDVAGCTS